MKQQLTPDELYKMTEPELQNMIVNLRAELRDAYAMLHTVFDKTHDPELEISVNTYLMRWENEE